MQISETSAKRLGDLIRERRTHIGLRQTEIIAAAGVSIATWRLIERGAATSFRGLTLAGVEKALEWPRGTIAEIVSPRGLSVQRTNELIECPDTKPPGSDALEVPLEMAALSGKLERLTAKERAAVETLIDTMLED